MPFPNHRIPNKTGRALVPNHRIPSKDGGVPVPGLCAFLQERKRAHSQLRLFKWYEIQVLASQNFIYPAVSASSKAMRWETHEHPSAPRKLEASHPRAQHRLPELIQQCDIIEA